MKLWAPISRYNKRRRLVLKRKAEKRKEIMNKIAEARNGDMGKLYWVYKCSSSVMCFFSLKLWSNWFKILNGLFAETETSCRGCAPQLMLQHPASGLHKKFQKAVFDYLDYMSLGQWKEFLLSIEVSFVWRIFWRNIHP